jgi:hypothetical protein
MRASGSAFASLRSTAGVRSRRIESARILPSIESTMQGNHTHEAQGISRRQHESGVSADGMTSAVPPRGRKSGQQAPWNVPVLDLAVHRRR